MPINSKVEDYVNVDVVQTDEKGIKGTVTSAPKKDIKHIIRGMNKQNLYGDDGSLPVYEIEAYIREYLNSGYTLAKVEVLGQDPNMIQMFYVLVKE